MEVLPTIGSSQPKLGRRLKKGVLRFTLKAVQSEVVREERQSASGKRSLSGNGVRLFVGLPLDAVSSECKTINNARAIAAGMKALKLLKVEGVELPKMGLKLHVSLCFHGSKRPYIPLPKWVSQIGESEPGIFFTDRSGQYYKEGLSLGVDDVPVLNGKTPVQVYQSFCESFKSAFSQFMGSVITGISMGLGSDGELRYPSYRQLPNDSGTIGAGEFQCYDKNMLSILKQHAEASGNPLWGLGGPHDAPTYNQSPNTYSFFRNGGSWESPYGDFFLTWYANQLLTHGDRLLSIAASTFSDTTVSIYGKVPLMHSWYRMQSHPSELTAGFYNTVKRDGYKEVAKIFAKNSCKMILPGMNLSDTVQPQETLSSPEMLLSQIMAACRDNGVEVSGENSSGSGAFGGFEQIKKNIIAGDNNVLDLFMYHRMGASLFSPEHFPSFTKFVRSLTQQEMHSDDVAAESHVKNSEPSMQI
ncbi:hypothetical protein K1719_036495 [Acacia pycnantha]|nr:hypothetical protein K1719_036495 [Acacia pycnantha]